MVIGRIAAEEGRGLNAKSFVFKYVIWILSKRLWEKLAA
jgi:hypothetical protein